jgi:uncharacterized membrane protein YfcA
LVVGFVGGALGALLGVGGGVIIVPGLLLFTTLGFRSAVATSLVCIVATSVAGSVVFLKRRATELHLATTLQFFTVTGAVAAGLVAAYVPVAFLYFTFATLLLAVSYLMWPRPTQDHPPGAAPDSRDRRRAAGASLGAGVMAGLLGVGGGVLNVPVLHLLLKRPFERAIATSVYMVGITAAAGAAVYLVRGDAPLDVIGVTMLGTLAGARLSALAGFRLDQRVVKILFVLLLVYTAFRMGARGIAQF